MKINQLLLTVIFFVSIHLKAQKPIQPLLDNLNTHIEKNKIPGVMLSIVKSDSIIFSGGLGFANINTKEKVTGDHLFRLGSISKTFTAIGILKLVGEGKVSLNTPIKEINSNLPIKNLWENEAPITIEHTLEHTAGFDDMHLHAIYNKIDSVTPTTFSMIESHKNSLITRWKAGTRKAYSNPGYIVAGHVLEKVSNLPYNIYLKNNILNPLGMSNSGYYFKAPKNKLLTQGYKRNGSNLNPIQFTSIQGGPAGELCATANDMSKFLQFMLKRDGFKIDSLSFTKQTFDRIENANTTLASKAGLKGGYGLASYSIWQKGKTFFGHGGGIDGFSSRYLYSRDADFAVAVSVNRNANATEIAKKVIDYFVGDKKTNRVIKSIPDSISKKYSGYYCFKSPRHKLLGFTDRMMAGIELDFKKDSVLVKGIFGKPKATLFYAGNGKFYRDKEGFESVVLLESDDKKPALWFNENYTEMESKTKRIIINIAIWLSLLLPLFFFIYATIRLTIQFFKKNQKINKTNNMILWSASLCYILLFVGFSGSMADPGPNENPLNFYSILLYVSSLLMIVFSILSFYRIFKIQKFNFYKIYYSITAIAMLILCIFLYDSGFIGLQLWNY